MQIFYIFCCVQTVKSFCYGWTRETCEIYQSPRGKITILQKFINYPFSIFIDFERHMGVIIALGLISPQHNPYTLVTLTIR